MATRKKRPEPLSSSELTQVIRQCVTEGAVAPFPHFRSRGYQRYFTIQDAINVLRYGTVSSDTPQWDEKSEMWTYLVHGPDLEGDVLTVVIRVYSKRSRVWLVTAY